MARIDAAYDYLMTTYGKTTGSRYDSHKKSELRSVYNSIVKSNKESPLYKFSDDVDVTKFAIDIKENAHNIQNVIFSLSEDGDDIASIFNKKIAVSSDEDAVSVTYVGDDDADDTPTFDMEVKQLAKPQVNTGNFLRGRDHSFEEGAFSFDLDTTTNSYEFQFNVNAGDNNYDIQSKIARLVNQSDTGLSAEVIYNDAGESALQLSSKQTGLADGESELFRIQSGSSFNELQTLGIAQVSSEASNSLFVLNGKEHSSLSNTFTINRTFEVTLHEPTDHVHIGFKANTDAISDSVETMLSAYNGMVEVGAKYSTGPSNSRLFNEITSIGNRLAEPLAAAGITADENHLLSLDREQFAEAITSEDADTHYQTLNSFKSALSRTANKTSINPMNYVDKVIVEYKNPGHTLTAPYAPSAYAGLLVDRSL